MNKKILEKFIGANLLNAKPYNPPVDRKDFMKLDLNEGYYFLNDEIIKEIKEFDHFILSSYPEYGDLTKQIAQYAERPSEEVCLTNGSDHALQIFINIFFHKGDKVVVPSPVFSMYYYLLGLVEAEVVPVFYRENDESFIFPIDEILDSINADTKGIMLCNPNNPLGSSFTKEQLKMILEKSKEFDIPVILDEVYFEFGGYSAAELLDEFDNLIILRSFSKCFGLAGIRLGYVLAKKEVIGELVKLRMPWGVNHFAVHCGKVVLRHTDYFKEKIKETNETKQELLKYLNGRGIKCYGSETNFIVAKFGDCAKVVKKLKEEKILINDISHYQYANGILNGAVRINIPSKNDFEKFKAVFEKNGDLCAVGWVA